MQRIAGPAPSIASALLWLCVCSPVGAEDTGEAAEMLARGIRARETRVESIRGSVTTEVWRSARAAQSTSEEAKRLGVLQTVSADETYGHYVTRFLLAQGRWYYRCASVIGLFDPPCWEADGNLGGRLVPEAAAGTRTGSAGEYVQVVEIGDGKRRLMYTNASALLAVSSYAEHALPADQNWLGRYLFVGTNQGSLGKHLLEMLALQQEPNVDAKAGVAPRPPWDNGQIVTLTFGLRSNTIDYDCEVGLRPDQGYAASKVYQCWRPRDKSRGDAQAYGKGQLWVADDLQELSEDLWAPKRITIQSFAYGPGIEEPWRETCRLTFHELVVNGPWDENEFAFDPPIGTRISGPGALFPGAGAPWVPQSPGAVKPQKPPAILDQRLDLP